MLDQVESQLEADPNTQYMPFAATLQSLIPGT